jgi:sterol desaturase/sphingolipid hydroxylase (fatty acid hydroxylase superfamily)
MTFLFTYGHLRHSHMWIAFTGPAGRILHSPAHHQLHHSDDPKHFGKNLGFALSVWDWAFGTLVIPAKTREPVVFGVGADNAVFRSVAANLLIPFARLSERVSRGIARRAGRAGQGLA